MYQRRTTSAPHEGFCVPGCPDDCVGGTGDTSNMRSMAGPAALVAREQIAAVIRQWAATYEAVARGSDESLAAEASDMPETMADAVLNLGFDAADGEARRLRVVIENAPHANGCSWFNTSAGLSCTCWKAAAL